MKRIAFALLSLAASVCQGHETLFDSVFGSTSDPLIGVDTEKVRIEGRLPAGWMENASNWARIKASCKPMAEGGLRFTRFELLSAEDGCLQVARRSPIKEPGYYRASFKYRLSPGAPVFETGFRLDCAPYKFLTKFETAKAEGWQDCVQVFRVRSVDKPTGVWINITKPGYADVARMKLERLDEAQLKKESAAAHPDGGPANLFRNAVLPCGLQTGWLIDRDTSDDDVTAEADPSVIGPSGVPALKLSSGLKKTFSIHSEPFKSVLYSERHALSVRCKGSGKLWIALNRDGESLSGKEFTLSPDEWKVLSIEYDPAPFFDMEKAKLAVSGTMWVDAFEAAPLSKAGKFAMVEGGNVAGMSLPESDASAAKIQFENEKPQVIVKAFGSAANATLKAEAGNLYGDKQALKPVAIERGKAVMLDFSEALAKRPYGAFRIEAWLERDGRRISPVNEIVVYRLRRPKHWGEDAPKSPFGVHMVSLFRHIVMAKAIGANWSRLHDAGMDYICWWNLEPEKGQWQFFDKDIERYRDGKIMLYGELSTAPAWASYFPSYGKNAFKYADRFSAPRDLADFGNYVRTVASRYKGVIDFWDIWNEPWSHGFWHTGYDKGRDFYRFSKSPVKDFAALSKTAYDAMKAANPKAALMGFNSNGGTNTGKDFDYFYGGEAWGGGLLKEGAGECADGFAYHIYESGANPGAADDPVKTNYDIAVAPLKEKYGKLPFPVWMSEGNCYSGDATTQHRFDYGIYKRSLPIKNTDNYFENSDRLLKFMLSLASLRVERWFLYSMHCYYSGEFNECSVIVMPDGQLHPTGAAHSAFAFMLEGKSFVKQLPLADNAWAFVFADAKEAVAVLSGTPRERSAALKIPEGCQAYDIFGNPAGASMPFNGRVAFLVFKDANEAEAGVAAIREGVPL